MNETIKDKELKDSQLTDIVSLRVQKLASALYLVSGFINDPDPLKWRLRELSLNALSATKSGQFDLALAHIRQLISLLDVALTVPGVSQMNFSILRQEYEVISQELTKQASLLSFIASPSVLTNS